MSQLVTCHEFVKCEYGNHYYPKAEKKEHYETCVERRIGSSKKALRAGGTCLNSFLLKVLNKFLFTVAQLTPTELVDNASKKADDDDSWEIEAGPAFKLAKQPEAAPDMRYLTIQMFLVLGCSFFPNSYLAFPKI